MQALAGYTQAIRSSLQAVLCLREFPSEIIEKQSKPEIELASTDKEKKLLLMNPIVLARNEKEKCLIESSINSVRISFCFKKTDELDTLISKKFGKFFSLRAELFEVLRRKPLDGYDVTFLVTSTHLEKFEKNKLIEFFIEFVENFDKDVSEIKLNIITQTRVAASYFMNELAGN
mmetsp:Transcript_59646/g.69113  ORF Transcript_59646/g.69113 Transcript_59646/m.69113 type:complete len:175 (+) Transcript_59646:43-567(+)